jgi:TonB family protein
LVAQRLEPYQNNKGKWGYKDEAGKVKIKAKYDAVASFEQGLAVINLKQKQGVINTKGRYVLKPKYRWVEVIAAQTPLFKVMLTYRVNGSITYTYGIVGAKGKIIVPIAYNYVAPVNSQQLQAGFIVAKAQQYALLGANGKPLTGFDYTLMRPQTHTSQRILARKQKAYGYLDLQGKVAIPFEYSQAANFRKGKAKVELQGASFEIDETGKRQASIPQRRDDYSGEIYMIVEQQAMPKGGMRQFYKYIADNLKYPPQAKRMGVEGRVYAQFIVEKDGYITDIKILKGIGSGCDEEAVRLLKNAAPWIPAKNRGRLVRVRRSIPITFKIK